MRVLLRHHTTYRYADPALLGPHVVRLRPAVHGRARVLNYDLAVEPKAELRWQHDPWGNRIARLTFGAGAPISALELKVELGLEIRPVNPFDFFVDDRCRELPFVYPDGLDRELEPFLAAAHPKPGPRLSRFLEGSKPTEYITDHVVAVNARVAKETHYVIRNEPGLQTSEQTLELASGSCRDSAVLLCDIFRAQGLAARFVSGYLVQLADEGNIPGVAKGVLKDVVDLHAWCEIYVPGAGWIGLDGTSGLLTGEGHIPLASSARPELAAPVDGTSSTAATGFDVTMEVIRLGHEPRPRHPYTDEEWSALVAAGHAVDARLDERGLRLTMGGEPTWTSREHTAEPEWNEGAMGPTKWKQGLVLVRELRKRLAPEGSLVMSRMGKLYPGESLPRWNLDLVWRSDGRALWRDQALMDLGETKAKPARIDDSARFVDALAKRLGLDGNSTLTAYEDPWVAIVKEMNFPADIDPMKAGLADPEERQTLARALTRGLANGVGHALPLARGTAGWQTSQWSFRRKHLFLLWGDSPMGYRLPLESVGGKAPPFFERDPTFADGAPLPEFQPRAWDGKGNLYGDTPHEDPARELLPGETVRTALCVEPREGVLHVFLPPTHTPETFVELLSAIEDVAAMLKRPVRVEGYGPPSDPRIERCVVTPDPGVLEVNLPPRMRWGDYVELMDTVHDAANHSGLTAEKYQVDGREIGSGGGHHITLGGPSVMESPFIQRPELVAGFLRYLQNHPSLSYLFTGLFVGPTSQAPRVDEARHSSLYELELAMQAAEAGAGTVQPPWRSDRLFRNLLADVSGNTHRTEVSIDKLYDPYSPAGRQGLIEMRAFEMPPHERMASAQMLLARAIVARLASEPYQRPLIRWGSELHDRFLLPHYLWADFKDVARDLRDHGLPLQDAWYRPFLDYRLPLYGRLAVDNVVLEVRAAFEPWSVLPEAPTPTGTSRYVDSSVERLEVHVEGLIEGRHAIGVNGFALPLRETGTVGERVAGVRYRAWQAPHCLQPDIGLHHPIRVDLIDTWARRSLGAATHHVWHPEGRGYKEPPLTAVEAAARRASRFTIDGHAQYPVALTPTEPHPETPFTLDLRRYSAGYRKPLEEA